MHKTVNSQNHRWWQIATFDGWFMWPHRLYFVGIYTVKHYRPFLTTVGYYVHFCEVKLTFEMLTMRGQQHSFSTHGRVFFWKCQSFRDRKCIDLSGALPFIPDNLWVLWSLAIPLDDSGSVLLQYNHLAMLRKLLFITRNFIMYTFFLARSIFKSIRRQWCFWNV